MIDGQNGHNSSLYNDETLLITGMTFDRTGSDTADAILDSDFITSGPCANKDRGKTDYAHNITVENCTFIDDNNLASGIRFRQEYDVTIRNCTAKGLETFVWMSGGDAIKIFENIVVEDCDYGLNLNTYPAGAQIRNVVISANKIGINLDPQTINVTTAVVSNCKITAPIPIATPIAYPGYEANYGLTASVEDCVLNYTDSTLSGGIAVTDRDLNPIADPGSAGRDVTADNNIEKYIDVTPFAPFLTILLLLKRMATEYTVTVETEGSGSVTSSDEDNSVRYSKDITFTAIPDEGSVLSAVLLDGEEIALNGENEYTIEKVKADHTVTFIFTEIEEETVEPEEVVEAAE